MADPHWTSYVGMITGISGAIMGFIGYRKVNAFKSLDLRLELRKSVNSSFQKHSELSDLIATSNGSRKATAAAAGMTSSGRMQLWEQEVEKDTKYINELKEQSPEKDESFTSLTTEKLESKLVEAHDLQETLLGLIDKYKSAIEEDNKTIIKENATE